MLSLKTLVNFSSVLRAQGFSVDNSQLALATKAVLLVGVESYRDIEFSLESVLVSNEEDRFKFRELLYNFLYLNTAFKQQSKSVSEDQNSMLESDVEEEGIRGFPEVKNSNKTNIGNEPNLDENSLEAKKNVRASNIQRLQSADFRTLSEAEIVELENFLRDTNFSWPQIKSRRYRAIAHQEKINWSKLIWEASKYSGDDLVLPQKSKKKQCLPLLILVDVSGSMTDYSRSILTFLHRSTKKIKRHVFAFSTDLTDLTEAFKHNDASHMIGAFNLLVDNFGSGTKLGYSLQSLLLNYKNVLIGRRTVVLLVTDGLDTGDGVILESAVMKIKLRSRKLIWLNPLLRFDGYAPLAQGPKVLNKYVDMVLPVHNFDSLISLTTAVGRAI